MEWESADDVHYPGTYVHGGYNRETTILGGLPVLNEDLVNMPNWLVLQLRIEGEDAVRLADLELLDYRHELDIRTATVRRFIRFRDRSGRQTTLESRRFVSMATAITQRSNGFSYPMTGRVTWRSSPRSTVGCAMLVLPGIGSWKGGT